MHAGTKALGWQTLLASQKQWDTARPPPKAFPFITLTSNEAQRNILKTSFSTAGFSDLNLLGRKAGRIKEVLSESFVP